MQRSDPHLGESRSPLPDQVTMGLLAYLNAHALDEDYAVAAHRRHAGESKHQRRPIGRYGAAALAVFAVLGVTAAVQTSRNEGTEERDRRQLIEQISTRKDALAEDRVRIESLATGNDRLETQLLRSDTTTSGVLDRLTLLGVRDGTIAVRGPGVRVTVDDAPNADEDERRKVLDTDLQQLVNGLWQAGAEAIAINNHRLTNLSAIRRGGTAITVNFKSLSRPYVVQAIGDPDTLPSRFGSTSSGQTWLDLQQQVGLTFDMRVQRSLLLPGADTRSLRYAVPLEPPERKSP